MFHVLRVSSVFTISFCFSYLFLIVILLYILWRTNNYLLTVKCPLRAFLAARGNRSEDNGNAQRMNALGVITAESKRLLFCPLRASPSNCIQNTPPLTYTYNDAES